MRQIFKPFALFFGRLAGPTEPLEVQAYRRIRSKGFEPGAIIDVGAYEGHWTRLARSVFHDAPVVMVEAQTAKKTILDAVCRDVRGVTLENSVLSATAGEEVVFYEMETGSSLRPENSNVPRVERRLMSKTLDDIAIALPGPIFLKVDVQGAELDILRGGQSTLARSEVVQLETALLPYNDGAPQIVDLLVQMREWGFVPLDFAGFIRPNGIDLVQTDIIFVRSDSDLRATRFVFSL